MTDDLAAAFGGIHDDIDELTPDELLEQQARAVAKVPPERIADAAGLPDDVREGRIEDDGEAHADVQEHLITEPKED